jgi:hypothetical protein
MTRAGRVRAQQLQRLRVRIGYDEVAVSADASGATVDGALLCDPVRELLRCSDPCQNVRPKGHGFPAPGDRDDVVQGEVAPVDDGQPDLLLRRGNWFI